MNIAGSLVAGAGAVPLEHLGTLPFGNSRQVAFGAALVQPAVPKGVPELVRRYLLIVDGERFLFHARLMNAWRFDLGLGAIGVSPRFSRAQAYVLGMRQGTDEMVRALSPPLH